MSPALSSGVCCFILLGCREGTRVAAKGSKVPELVDSQYEDNNNTRLGTMETTTHGCERSGYELVRL